MTPYVMEEVPSEAVEAWGRACRMVEAAPDGVLRCHELARAVARVVGGEVLDGSCGLVDHSWVVLKGGHVLDPYFPGVLPQCVLVLSSWPAPAQGLYQAGAERDDVDEELVGRLVGIFEEVV